METLEKFLIKHRDKITFLLAIYLFLVVLSALPYFNLVFTQTVIFFILIILFFFVFRVSSRFFLYLSLLIFPFLPISTLLHQSEIEETLGNIIFVLLLIAFIVEFGQYLKRTKNAR